jgi:Leucine-rich repeat (LRR) protein
MPVLEILSCNFTRHNELSNMKFRADQVEYWNQNQVETVFFGQEAKELALIISSVPNTTDHYLEWNDQSNACYNGVREIRLSREELYLQLLPEQAKQLGLPELTVEFDCDEDVYKEVTRCLTLIFRDKLVVKQGEVRKKTAPAKDYSKVKYLNLEGKNLRELPDYVREMVLLEKAILGYNPKMDLQAAFEVLALLPQLKQLTYSTESSIPESIGKLIHLETLTINGLTKPCTLPDSFGQLTKLSYLLLMSDADIILPESFADLTALEDLYIRAAGYQLPSRFYQLTRLKQLDFTNCRFEQVPPEMAAMKEVSTVIFGSPEARDFAQIMPVLAQMPNLKVLEMSVNPVPAAIGVCKNIEELILWTGFGNETPLHLPDELFELKQLRKLMLNMNHFDSIPAAIGQMKGLKSLIFMESSFENLPDSIGELSNLEFLNISENPTLKSLPESLGKLTSLKELYLKDNPQLTALPESVKNLTNLESVAITNRETLKNIPDSWSSLFIEP